MQGYAFIAQRSMRVVPGEAERAGKARCEARWGPWRCCRRCVLISAPPASNGSVVNGQSWV